MSDAPALSEDVDSVTLSLSSSPAEDSPLDVSCGWGISFSSSLTKRPPSSEASETLAESGELTRG